MRHLAGAGQPACWWVGLGVGLGLGPFWVFFKPYSLHQLRSISHCPTDSMTIMTSDMASFEMKATINLQDTAAREQYSATSCGSGGSISPGCSIGEKDASWDERLDSAPQEKVALTAKSAAKDKRKGKNAIRSTKRNVICLDYLKGICSHERYHCKYLHAKVHSIHPVTKETVCQTFILTGYCKFGENCSCLHPQADDPHFQDVRRSNLKGQRSVQPVPPKRETAKNAVSAEAHLKLTSASLEEALRRANAMLNSLAFAEEDAVVRAIERLLANHPQVTLHHLVSLMFFTVMNMKRDKCVMYASLCKRLFTSSEQNLQEIVSDIMGRVSKLSEMLPVDASSQLKATIFRKQMGFMRFREVLKLVVKSEAFPCR